MIYRVSITGYMIVEADSKSEAFEKADNEDYIEEAHYCEDAEEFPDYE